MIDVQKENVRVPKKKIAHCDKICTYESGGKEPQRCKGKCVREPGHVVLNCKCRTHEMS